MEYRMAILNILQQRGIYYGHLAIFDNLVHFPPFWYVLPRNIWQPWMGVVFGNNVITLSAADLLLIKN
jgi:hypothetical protein